MPTLSFRAPHVLALLVTLGTILAGTPARAQGDTAAARRLFEDARHEAARTELRAVLRLRPRDANAMYLLGRIALEEGRTGEAVEWMEKAVAHDDRNALHHLWLGNALGQSAQTASRVRQPFIARRVKQEFERAVALDSTSIDARFGLVQFYAIAPGLMGGSMEKAREHATGIARLSRMHGHFALAALAQRERRLDVAEQEYQRAVAASPDSVVAYLRLVAFQQRQRQWTQAFATLDRAQSVAADDPRILLQVGRTTALSGLQLERGEASLRRWLAAPPRGTRPAVLAAAHVLAGRIHRHRGEAEAAKAAFAEALRIDPGNAEAKAGVGG